MYDHTKGGVDIADLLSINHSTRIKSKRWPLNALSLVLDTCRTNAKTICGETTLKLTILSLTMSLEKLLSSQAFNDDLKIQRSSDQNPQQTGTCFSYPRSKPLPTSWKSKNKKWELFRVSMKLLVPLTTKTNVRNWTTNWNRNVTYVANFCVKFIKNQPNMYPKIVLLKTNKHLLVIHAITLNAL